MINLIRLKYICKIWYDWYMIEKKKIFWKISYCCKYCVVRIIFYVVIDERNIKF